MVIISVKGVTHHGLKDMSTAELKAITAVELKPDLANKHDSRAIAVYGQYKGRQIQIGFVGCADLPRAHKEEWSSRDWKIADIGRFRPEHAYNDLVFCKVTDTEAHAVSPKKCYPMMHRLKYDDTLYDGKTCVSIYYASKSSGLAWRDVVLKSKTSTSLFACDGTHDKAGRLIPQKEFKFSQLRDAAVLPEWETSACDIEDNPTKRARKSIDFSA
eukprot:COSAG05_NODE_2707_length_2743_cov_21.041225_3_plen_215_part_00